VSAACVHGEMSATDAVRRNHRNQWLRLHRIRPAPAKKPSNGVRPKEFLARASLERPDRTFIQNNFLRGGLDSLYRMSMQTSEDSRCAVCPIHQSLRQNMCRSRWSTIANPELGISEKICHRFHATRTGTHQAMASTSVSSRSILIPSSISTPNG